MENIFLRYMREGRIRNLEDLKGAYRALVMKTHPDAVGSDALVEEYIRYSGFYEEAKAVFAAPSAAAGAGAVAGDAARPTGGTEAPPDYRLLFYREFYTLERLDLPYAFNKYYYTRMQIETARRKSFEYFSRWQGGSAELYGKAQAEYGLIKAEKPRGQDGKYAMLFNLTPVLHNILSYQMTGLAFYKKQLKQNFSAVLSKLEERGALNLIAFIRFLIRDMENGPAIMGG